MKRAVSQFDTSVTQAVIDLPNWMQPIFLGITALGSPIVVLSIGVVIAIIGHLQTNFRLIISGGVIWATLIVSSLIKIIVARERPLTEYAKNLIFDTNSFPSGHACGSMITYGLLAYIAWTLLPQPFNIIVPVLLGALIVAIGISRIYLGAHFPSDVFGGWLLGLVTLCLIIFIMRPLA